MERPIIYISNSLTGRSLGGVKKWRRRHSGERIEWIVVHYTGMVATQGDPDTAARAIARSKRAASTHYLVGDHVVQLLPVKYAAYHVGAKDDGKLIPCYNGNSIGVDLCECKLDCSSGSVSCNDWYFTPQTLANGARLIAYLAQEHGMPTDHIERHYGIPTDHIVRHYDVTHKRCPRPFVGTDINAYTGQTHESAWREFVRTIDALRNGE